MSKIFQKKKNIELKRSSPKKINLDIMIDVTLPATFNADIWEKISASSPEVFIRNQ